MRILKLWLVAIACLASTLTVQAQNNNPRIALVIGQSAYTRGALPTAVNDAGLVAQSLTDSGFEVIEGSNLDGFGIRQTVLSFLNRVGEAGQGIDVVVYISGYAVQLEGDNYILPVNFTGKRDLDIAKEGFRLSDIIRPLTDMQVDSKIIIVDSPFQYPDFTIETVAPGLAYIDPPKNFLIAFASAPGRALPVSEQAKWSKDGTYGEYAGNLVQAMREPGIGADEAFKRLRAWVHEDTQGLWTPWHVADQAHSFIFFPLQEGETPPTALTPPAPSSAEATYALAVETDTIAAYQAFLRQYPDHPLSTRVKSLLTDRREALFWNKTVKRNTPEAYWTYLKTYKRGPHVADARRRLAMLSRPLTPPDDFSVVIYDDLPPPLPYEVIYEETYIYNDYPSYRTYALPPLFPSAYLPMRPMRGWRPLPPPPPPAVGILPVPAPLPFPERARPPREFVPRYAPVTPRGAVAIPIRPPVVPLRPGAQQPAIRQLVPPGTARPMRPDDRWMKQQPGLSGPIIPLAPSDVRNPRNRPQPGLQPAPIPGARPGAVPLVRPAQPNARPVTVPVERVQPLPDVRAIPGANQRHIPGSEVRPVPVPNGRRGPAHPDRATPPPVPAPGRQIGVQPAARPVPMPERRINPPPAARPAPMPERQFNAPPVSRQVPPAARTSPMQRRCILPNGQPCP